VAAPKIGAVERKMKGDTTLSEIRNKTARGVDVVGGVDEQLAH
jgi:hypothetical protein